MVPIIHAPTHTVVAVLDVDSDMVDAFSDHVDQVQLEALCAWLGERFGAQALQDIGGR